MIFSFTLMLHSNLNIMPRNDKNYVYFIVIFVKFKMYAI